MSLAHFLCIIRLFETTGKRSSQDAGGAVRVCDVDEERTEQSRMPQKRLLDSSQSETDSLYVICCSGFNVVRSN